MKPYSLFLTLVAEDFLSSKINLIAFLFFGIGIKKQIKSRSKSKPSCAKKRLRRVKVRWPGWVTVKEN